MRRAKAHFWYNIAMAMLIAAIAADLIFGLDVMLNAISTIFAVGFALVLVGLVGSAIVACCWIVVRDVIFDVQSDRRNGIAWRWRLLGYVGLFGILADGAVGAWTVYQEHILFSTAVEHIPFGGVPVLLALASYPVKWLEQVLLRKQSRESTAHLELD